MDIPRLRSPFETRQLIVPIFLFLGTLSVYLLTLCPTVYVGDSGEFIVNSLTLGINHPTGYPLATVLGRFCIDVSSSLSPAVTMNLLSAIESSLTVVCVFLIARLITSRISASIAAALLFAFSTTFWSHATTAEVYPLVLLSAAMAILCILLWERTTDQRYLLIAAYVTGLGLSQHVIGALVAVSLIATVIANTPKRHLNLPLALASFVLASLGWTIYLYIFVRATAHPPIAWGNPDTVGAFIHHFLPVGHRGLASYFQGQESGHWRWILEQIFTREFWYFGLAAPLCLYALRKRRHLIVLFLSIPVLNVAFTATRNTPLHADLDAYLMPVHLVMAILLGCGLSSMVDLFKERLQRSHDGWVWRGAEAFALLLMPLVVFLIHYQPSDRSKDYFGEDFAVNVYKDVEQNAIVFASGDEQTFLGWYLEYAKKSHPQITIVSEEFLVSSWAGSYLVREGLGTPVNRGEPPERIARRIIEKYIGRRPIYFTHRLPWESLVRDFSTRNIGMMIQILPPGSQIAYHPSAFHFHPPTTSNLEDERCKLLANYYPQQLAVNAQFWINRNDFGAATSELDEFFGLPFAKRNADLSTALLLRGIVSARQKDVRGALAMADSALRVLPGDWKAFQFRGEFSFMAGDTVGALKDWRRSLDLNPRNIQLQKVVSSLNGVPNNIRLHRDP